MENETNALMLAFLLERIQDGITRGDIGRIRFALMCLRMCAPKDAIEIWRRLPDAIREQLPQFDGDDWRP